MTLLRNNVDGPESSYAQVRIFARKKEDEKFQQVVHVIYKLEEFVDLLDVMNSLYDEVITNQPLCNVLWKISSPVNSLSIFFYSSQDELEHCLNRNLLLNLKSKLGLYHVELTTPKTSPRKLTPTVVEMQQSLDLEVEYKEENSGLKWTKYKDRRKVRVNFHTDTYKLNIVVYRYRNSLYLKENEVDLKLTNYQSLLAKRVYLLSYIDIFYKRCIVLDEKTVDN